MYSSAHSEKDFCGFGTKKYELIGLSPQALKFRIQVRWEGYQDHANYLKKTLIFAAHLDIPYFIIVRGVGGLLWCLALKLLIRWILHILTGTLSWVL